MNGNILLEKYGKLDSREDIWLEVESVVGEGAGGDNGITIFCFII